MFGKGTLIIVLGFTFAFAFYQLRLAQAVDDTVDNFNVHYMEEVAHQSALTAMNFGIQKVWELGTTSDTFNVVLNDITANVSISTVGLDTTMVKVTTQANAYDEEYTRMFGSNRVIKDSVVAYFSDKLPASSFFWFTNTEGSTYWVTGDTVWGPMHTNDKLYTFGSPVFYGKATARKGIEPPPTSPANLAEYLGGYEIGVANSVPTDASNILTAATAGNGGAAMNTMCLYDQPLVLEFLNDGRVVREVNFGAPDTVVLSAIAPTGVIHSTTDIRVKGVLNGKLTVYSGDDIFLDDDIVYASDPNVNPASDDVLGLVAYDDILITDNIPNALDIHIQASMMAMTGKFKADNYSTRGVCGTIFMTGGVIQDQRGPVGTFTGGGGVFTLTNGFFKNYKFDPRLSTIAPPYYPFVTALRLVAWWE